MPVYQLYVEKKEPFAVEARAVFSDLKSALGLPGLRRVRVLNRYFLEDIDAVDFKAAAAAILSEPQVDDAYDVLPAFEGAAFAAMYLPGQFDQRADSASQCIQIMTQKERPAVSSARVYLLEGEVSPTELEAVKRYLINPVEMCESPLKAPDTLRVDYPVPGDIPVLEGFRSLDEKDLSALIGELGLAMDEADIAFCQRYFKEEGRDPTLTELRLVDTYWSDHCRHTTFSTRLEHIDITPDYVRESFAQYRELRDYVYGETDRPVTLMDIATIGAKALKKAGRLEALDVSEEVNACSVKIPVDVDGRTEDWLLMFKNETHNHPTEIEPFGGAATCLGGAIRDPLSGRSYVYQAMRLTGAADPLVPVSQALKGKLPQRKIVTAAAAGYSSYGNQIGLCTGHVAELYHPGYVAKRMEVGAVIGAAPAENVVRQTPLPEDVVILLGGKTGRDGCGGATGSSKAHTAGSLAACGAEVQKGNAPEERKIQRLFRDPVVTRMIKRCNDFGAGGVSVAIGELADSLQIDLDAVPKKYDGLDGTELAISESQERMAVVVAPEDVRRFIALASAENLQATPVATVTDSGRLEMNWRGRRIVSLSRRFLNSNGAPKTADVTVDAPTEDLGAFFPGDGESLRHRMEALVTDLNVCSQKGLVERFDSTIGAGSVLLPFGGRTQNTPAQAMAAKIPVLGGETDTASVMAWGFNPYIAEQSPYHGAVYAVVESVARVLAAGGTLQNCHLSLQEYFERLRAEPRRWGKPFAALLGALRAQLELGVAAIGGKDSMSGSFENIDVPPTLISFAVSTARASRVISPEFKAPGHFVYVASPRMDADGLPDWGDLRRVLESVEALIQTGKAASAWVCGFGGVAEGLFKMSLGNRLGIEFHSALNTDSLFGTRLGAVILACPHPVDDMEYLGRTCEDFVLKGTGERVDLAALQALWESKLSAVFPHRLAQEDTSVPPAYEYASGPRCPAPAVKTARPRVLIPAFAGTNCEYDTARAFTLAGAECETFIVQNLSATDIEWSVREFESRIRQSQIIAIPGGFSGGAEPDGSGKFITAFFRNPRIRDAVADLLGRRDGLMIGICNGFQALVKLGLVPFGEILETDAKSPTLTFNPIGRHQSRLVRLRVASNLSPWLSRCRVNEVYIAPVSHGEGRFVADPALIARMAADGRIASQYVDMDGHPSMETLYNPNGSAQAIEAVSSPDGRVFGRMAHSERMGDNLYKGVPGVGWQEIFAAGVDYFQ
jgi:phosphoribosylformylglycinamidine synthase